MDQRILKSLLEPSAYPEPTASVRLIQTHVSFLFITEDFVYKVKKAVDLGFLNFTTLDRRRFYCDEEVRLNRRLSPDIYLGVVEVRQSEHRTRFQGEGSLVDYAVKMRRLPEEKMLDRLMATGAVTDDDIRRIARTIADFHLKAERSEEIDSYGTVECIRRNWDENFQQLAEALPSLMPDRDLQIIRGWAERFLADDEEIFNRRISQGHIRDCDGDIHSGNICLGKNVWIFDCIEFNKRFRYGDTAADIAFLLMDFDFHDRADLSPIFLAEYEEATGDHDSRTVLDFYKIYRAVIRGKVEGLRLKDPLIPEEDKEGARRSALKHFRLARGYVLRPRLPPTLIIMSGLMGSGKTTIATTLSRELGIGIASSDPVRKEIASVPKYSHSSSGYGDGIYKEEFTDATYAELLRRAERALAGGGSFIVDATFRRKRDRESFRALAARYSTQFWIVRTCLTEEAIRKRLDRRTADPAEVSDGRSGLLGKQRTEFEPLSADEGPEIRLDTLHPLEECVDVVLQQMGLL